MSEDTTSPMTPQERRELLQSTHAGRAVLRREDAAAREAGERVGPPLDDAELAERRELLACTHAGREVLRREDAAARRNRTT